tara:strand:+ start:168 stop:413 length:246 start_codon:yes stop_codon:yes gene_type:complete
MPAKKRDYPSEYKNYHSRPEQKLNRAARNKSRNELEKEGKVRKGDGMDVHHADGNPRNSNKSNLRIVPKRKNRSFSRKKGG